MTETDLKLFGQTSDEFINEELIQREDNTRHETQDNREKTSAEEVVDSEDNESNDGIDCHINDETNVGSDAEDNHLVNNDNTTDETQTKSETYLKPEVIEILNYTLMVSEDNDSQSEEYRRDLKDDMNNELNDSQNGSELNTKSNAKRKHKSIKCKDNGSETEEYGSGLSDNEMDDKSGDECVGEKGVDKGPDGKYACDYKDCKMSFNWPSAQRSHAFSHLNAKTKKSMIYKNRSDGRYECLMNACNAVYKRIDSLRSHQMSHLNEPFAEYYGSDLSDDKMDDQWIGWKPTRKGPDNEFVCDYKDCEKSYKKAESLRNHAFSHLSAKLKKSLAFKTRSDGIYVCLWGECIKTCKTIDQIRGHLMSHLEDPLKWSQTCCRNVLADVLNDESIDSQRVNELNTETNGKQKHGLAESEDNNSKPEECSIGLSDNEMDYKSCDEWMGEKRLKKCRNGKYVCDYRGCGLSFNYPQRIREHKFKHLNAKIQKSMAFKKRSDGRYVCLMGACNETYKELRRLRGHQMSHLNEPLKCPQTDCPFVAITRVALQKHVKTHPKPYACDTCGLKCKEKFILTQHKRIHNDASKLRCDWPECNRLFVYKHQLRYHMNTHTANVSHPCEWPGCGHTYTNIRSLVMHVKRMHKGMADYQCHWPGCDYKTTNGIRLKNH
ncbi:unnamed protein product [Medioppia subpectinata]|uniref:C2H2-type domain-containing protein n=1 Tax=Medioppia subpectinata TaxID=1979941 RepID=A0A7R9KFI2_9ACAR|nr:unnamed protein product [Medioppia subpectinata]CAG2101630.1 unnamed protein product [Medioppia subpectinata]